MITHHHAVYTPEMDCGHRLGNLPCRSANFWIPLDQVPNKDAIIEAGTVTTTAYDGTEHVYTLAHEVGNFLVVARHLFDDWSEHLDLWYEPEYAFPTHVFEDTIVLRDTQQKAWEALKDAKHGVLNLACGKGKTVLALKKIAHEGLVTLVAVNAEGLLHQWVGEIMDKLRVPKDQIGIVQGPKAQWDKPIVVGMLHTMANRVSELSEKVVQRFGLVIFDEAHHLPARTFIPVARTFHGHRIGLTATPDREDGLEPICFAHLGNVFFSDMRGELDAKIVFRPLPTAIDETSVEVQKHILDRSRTLNIGMLRSYVGTLGRRNKTILRDARRYLRDGRKVLVLTHPKDHPEELRRLAEKSGKFTKYKVGCVSGQVRGDLRGEIVQSSDITFATYGTSREFLDAPALDTLLCVTPFTAINYIQQGKGRLERRYANKKDPIVVIYEDKHVGPFRAMCKKLRRALKAEGYKFSVEREKAAKPEKRIRYL